MSHSAPRGAGAWPGLPFAAWVIVLALAIIGGWLAADWLRPVALARRPPRAGATSEASSPGTSPGQPDFAEETTTHAATEVRPPEPKDPLADLHDVPLEDLVGRMLMVGIKFEWSPDTPGVLPQIHPGFVILYARNVTSRSQVEGLVSDIVSCGEDWPLGRPVVAIDHEGGRVNRLHISGVEPFPANRSMAGQGAEAVAAEGQQMARELLSLGIRMNLAPVVDVTTNPHNEDIGDRSYGKGTDQVARLGRAFVSAAVAEGLLVVAKHFPGYGPIAENPHDRLPSVGMSAEQWREECLPPFVAAIDAGATGVMTGHVVYRALDSSGLPATLSASIVTDRLRNELEFGGLVLTDDLEMGAIAREYGIGDAAVRAVEAGCDVVLVCHTPERQLKAHQSLVRAVQDGRIARRRLEESVARIQAAVAP